jgi:hypothetical protein
MQEEPRVSEVLEGRPPTAVGGRGRSAPGSRRAGERSAVYSRLTVRPCLVPCAARSSGDGVEPAPA